MKCGMKSDKELFLWKKKTETKEAWDRKCAEKSPRFLEARGKDDFEACFHELCERMDITVGRGRFVYFFDVCFRFGTSIANIAPDYEAILCQGLQALYYEEKDCTNTFCERYNAVLSDLELLADRIVDRLKILAEKSSDASDTDVNPACVERQMQWFRRIKSGKAETFEEALQRILFLNQMLWQSGSWLVGLGRLDMLLYPYYQEDLDQGRIDRTQAGNMIREFLHTLHGYYWYKSSQLLGDTGQVMILGGSDPEGNYVYNDLTVLFLQCVKDCKLSDPKIVLRTNRKMPRELMEEAVRCMATGTGSPLLSNDDLIIPLLLEFGIEQEDAYAYSTSACWEPLIGGKSSSMNNQSGLVYTRALQTMLREEHLRNLDSFAAVKERFLFCLRREIIKCEKNLYTRVYWRNTLYSVFMDGCRESKKDITEGGARYHHVGMTTVGLGNAVNSLLNIQKYVFEEQRYSMTDVKKICVGNYAGYPEAAQLLSGHNWYGQDDGRAAALVNEIQAYVTKMTADFRTPSGGKLKFGISSPAYIMSGNVEEASFDGRKKGEPFVVHISNEELSSYTELMNFAAALDYGDNRFNGNVVDFMVSPSFMENHFDKFVTLLQRGMEGGCFQLQTNVLGSETLLEAKRSPEQFPNLIVRVWGFSAYFVELPESYQDLLIERAMKSERKRA